MPRNFQDREKVVGYLGNTLIGPATGEAEEIEGSPLLRYMMGILFPQEASADGAAGEVNAAADDGDDAGKEGAECSGTDARISLATEQLPSAVGISLKVSRGAKLSCEVTGGRYEKFSEGGRAAVKWKRIAIAPAGRPLAVELSPNKTTHQFEGQPLRLYSVWRPSADGTAIVTVSLVNTARAGASLDPASCVFQVGLSCTPRNGEVLPYPVAQDPVKREGEDKEVEFLYRAATPYARGHGAAAGWEFAGGTCTKVMVDFMPVVEVPQATFELQVTDVDPRVFSLAFLVTPENKDDALAGFRRLADSYERWIKEEDELASQKDADMASELSGRARSWLARMRRGIGELAEDGAYAWQAFVLANSAMAMQMALLENSRKGPFPRSESRSVPSLAPQVSGARWRPFQLAFALGMIESLMNPESEDRDTVDVIWFPTGGGKTEAYLLVSAFELIRRRLASGSQDKGTAIISRYTLRMLTSQQFERTGALFAALEILREKVRKRGVKLLGDRPFSLGLWAGGSLTPNRWPKAREALEEALLQSGRDRTNPFVLSCCPGCGTEIFPAEGGEEDLGIHSSDGDFYFKCPSAACEFRARIPVNVVDDSLYESPPSMLIGTIDKFADLAWRDKARSFFWGPDDNSIPPSLFIQDELHLISGPLGTIDAMYELALQSIVRAKGYKPPKIIASTATIRNARDQVRSLYGKRSHVFPSPINAWDAAYFFSTDRTVDGRLYVGVMAQGYIKPVVAMTWAAAALLQSTKEVPLGDAARDAYWSLLVYHNSLRELGKTVSASSQEIPDRIKAIATAEDRVRDVSRILELSSNASRNLAASISELQESCRGNGSAVDIVPCTSIVSVGVDISRLGVMLINGQPKTTSEYIQASSRVGRSREAPGLVMTLFSAFKPRDRSHYEDFRAYHESIYRFVEPTSVTPFAPEAIRRTLHASLVVLTRLASPWGSNEAASRVQFNGDEFARLRKAFFSVAESSADFEELSYFQNALDEVVSQWSDKARSAGELLRYTNDQSLQFQSLLRDFTAPPARGLWPTLRSMRHVDEEIPLVVFNLISQKPFPGV